MTTGDIVRLKSGGPELTVVGDSQLIPGKVLCQWFLSDGRCIADDFYPAMLCEVVTCKVDADRIECPVSGKFIDTMGASEDAAINYMDRACHGHAHRGQWR